MTKMKKAVSYVLVFLMVFSSFTILPSEFWGWADVYATDVYQQKSNTVATEGVTEPTTELENEVPAEIITEVPTQVATEEPTEATTDNLTSETTEPPTEVPTEQYTGSYIVGDFEYRLINNDATVEIVKYYGTSDVVVIPNIISDSGISAIEGKYITSIGEYAFANNSYLQLVRMSESAIMTIGDYAFYSCYNLFDVTFSSVLDYIGKHSFEYSSLYSVDLSHCQFLTAVSDYAFNGCWTLSNLTLGINFCSIGEYAFSNCYLHSIDLSRCENLIGIGAHAFEGADLPQGIDLSANKRLTFIGDYAFAYTGNYDYYYNPTDEYFNGYRIDLSANKELTTIGDYAFAYSGVDCAILGEGIDTIGKGAFSYSAIRDIDLSACKKITTINTQESHVFEECERLEGITLGEGITHIEDNAFYDCNALKYIDMSACDNLTTIGEDAFGGYSLYVSFGKGLEHIGDYAFGSLGMWELDLSVCPNLKTIGDYAFANGSLREVILNENIEHLGYGAFASNVYLNEVDMSRCKKLKVLDTSIFSFSIFQEKIIFGEGLTDITVALDLCDGREIRFCTFLKEIDMSRCENLTEIDSRLFCNCETLSKVTFGSGLTYIGEETFYNNISLEEVDLSATNLTTIDDRAFSGDTLLKTVKLPESLKDIGESAFAGCKVLTTVQILGKDLTTLHTDSLPNNDNCFIYCYKNSTTHNTLINNGYTNLRFFTDDVHITDITVNGTSVNNFSTGTRNYRVYLDDITDVAVVPVFEESDVNYTVTTENSIHTINVFDKNNDIVDTYKITVKEYGYTVTGDISLMLDAVSATKVGGSVALSAGTYKLKIAKGLREFGYNKTVTDYCNGLSLSEKYTSYITLNATGGTYTFQFDKETNKLVIKYSNNMPNEYLIGDLNTILKPVEGTTLSIGTQKLEAGTYIFEISIGGKMYGDDIPINDVTTSSNYLSNGRYVAYQPTVLNATGGMYTFILNTSTNRLEIRHTPTTNESKDDVHIAGDISLVLSDKDDNGADLTKATGTVELQEGTYTFKVYNYGTVYTSGTVINDKATKNLSSKYTKPVTLNATGGAYKFVFDKVTGALVVSLVEK